MLPKSRPDEEIEMNILLLNLIRIAGVCLMWIIFVRRFKKTQIADYSLVSIALWLLVLLIPASLYAGVFDVFIAKLKPFDNFRIWFSASLHYFIPAAAGGAITLALEWYGRHTKKKVWSPLLGLLWIVLLAFIINALLDITKGLLPQSL